ncbi:hypothetical protein QUB47_35835 [Microcoleus sp. AT9_B5]
MKTTENLPKIVNMNPAINTFDDMFRSIALTKKPKRDRLSD